MPPKKSRTKLKVKITPAQDIADQKTEANQEKTGSLRILAASEYVAFRFGVTFWLTLL
jgi:hypothetical protein